MYSIVNIHFTFCIKYINELITVPWKWCILMIYFWMLSYFLYSMVISITKSPYDKTFYSLFLSKVENKYPKRILINVGKPYLAWIHFVSKQHKKRTAIRCLLISLVNRDRKKNNFCISQQNRWIMRKRDLESNNLHMYAKRSQKSKRL